MVASMKECALSLQGLQAARDAGHITEGQHERAMAKVKRDIAKNGGLAGLEAEGRRKRQETNGPDVYTRKRMAGYFGPYGGLGEEPDDKGRGSITVALLIGGPHKDEKPEKR